MKGNPSDNETEKVISKKTKEVNKKCRNIIVFAKNMTVYPEKDICNM